MDSDSRIIFKLIQNRSKECSCHLEEIIEWLKYVITNRNINFKGTTMEANKMADWLENIAVEKKGKARIINIGTFIKEVMEWERCSGSYLMEKAPLLRFLGLYRFLL